jgi:hypothetical protein
VDVYLPFQYGGLIKTQMKIFAAKDLYTSSIIAARSELMDRWIKIFKFSGVLRTQSRMELEYHFLVFVL